jgi:acyl dehydratase
MGITVGSVEEYATHVGEHLGWSAWTTVTQEQVNTFADATGDHQWIHVDPERAKDGPFGGTIAHGYLTLSMIPVLMAGMIDVKGVRMGVNYGMNRVRFPSPVHVGHDIRLGATLVEVTEIAGGAQSVVDVTIEERDAAKPSCVAEVVFRIYF